MSPTGGPATFLLLGGAAAAVFMAPQRFRPAALLAASACAFFALPGAAAAILPSIAVAFVAGIALDRLRGTAARRSVLALSILLLLLPFLALRLRDPLLLTGVAFGTLQLIGYVADVYRRDVPAERSPCLFALFGGFFPLLAAGPIERSEHLLPQLRNLPGFDYDRVRSGAWAVFLGVFKLRVLADTLAAPVRAVFEAPSRSTGGELLLGSALARYELFFELSGATDIALGSAAILGVALVPNFDRPFAAGSLLGFWRRWHISLSRWFEDYVYAPLSGLKTGRALALTLSFLLLGLWQGFGWNFAAFGILQAALILCPLRLGRAFNFLGPVCLPMILLRTRDLSQAGAAFARILVPADPGRPWADLSSLLAAFPSSWVSIGLLIALYETLQLVHARRPLGAWLGARPAPVRWAIYLLAALCFVAFGHFEKPLDYAYRSF